VRINDTDVIAHDTPVCICTEGFGAVSGDLRVRTLSVRPSHALRSTAPSVVALSLHAGQGLCELAHRGEEALVVYAVVGLVAVDARITHREDQALGG
jgi:hypothetical protein